jgi:hypothetical protein
VHKQKDCKNQTFRNFLDKNNGAAANPKKACRTIIPFSSAFEDKQLGCDDVFSVKGAKFQMSEDAYQPI